MTTCPASTAYFDSRAVVASSAPPAKSAGAGRCGPRVLTGPGLGFPEDVCSPAEGVFYEAFVPKDKKGYDYGCGNWKDAPYWITQLRKEQDRGEWCFVWEYEDPHKGDGWRAFHDGLSEFVEDAFMKGHKSCDRHIRETNKPGHHNYRWDLKELKQYRHINGKIVATKNIRRILQFVPHSAEWHAQRTTVC